MLLKILRVLRLELRDLLLSIVMHLPDTHMCGRIRLAYWRNRLRNDKLRLVGFAAKIHGSHLLELGENFILGDHAVMVIGDSDPVYVGDNCAIAYGSYVRSANHRFDDVSAPILAQGHSSKRIEYRGRNYSIVIEDDVWVGARCIVLTGAFIGRGSVVAAGSVVSSAIPEFSIVAGNPARVVANRKKMAELLNTTGGLNAKI